MTKKMSNKIFLTLLTVEVALLLLFIITSMLPDHNISFIPAETAKKLHILFHLGLEKNIPSAFSALQLVFAGLVALYCLRADVANHGFSKTRPIIWISVCLIFFFLAWDEYFSFHEGFGQVVEKSELVSASSLAQLKEYMNVWTIVAGLMALSVGTIGIFAFRKIFSEFRYLFNLLLLAGFLFVVGALGMEDIQTYLAAHNINIFHLPFLFQMTEEFLEMFGVSLTIFVFVRYIEESKIKA